MTPTTPATPRTPTAPATLPAPDRRTVLAAGLGIGLALGAVACARTSAPSTASPSAAATGAASASPAAPSAPATTASPSPTPSPTPAPLAGWSLEEMAGQLLVIGAPADSPASVAQTVAASRLGGVFLSGRSRAGTTAVRAGVEALRSAAGEGPHGTPLLIATDQEGGAVQVLRGAGFSDIPAALDQAAWDPDALRESAATWGAELASAGVTLNLAPCADLVDGGNPAGNAPIGAFGREYGHDAATVVSHAGAFASGMEDGGVVPVLKHFPGLGRVVQNTDTSSGVTDTVTQAGDAALGAFAEILDDGRPVMVSSAVYSLIDPDAPACFSTAVVTGLLRVDMGFDGVVVTDDLAAAAQVSAWSPGDRAVLAVRAGCDLVLASADSSTAVAMVEALVAAAREDEALAARVEESAERVLRLKGVLPAA